MITGQGYPEATRELLDVEERERSQMGRSRQTRPAAPVLPTRVLLERGS